MPFTRLPRSEAERAQRLKLLANSLPEFAETLEITPEELEQLVKDAENYSYLLDLAHNLEAINGAFFRYKDQIMEGGGAIASAPPEFPVISLPAGQTAGVIPRLRALIRKIKAAPGFNKQIGEALGLIIDTPTVWDPVDGSPDVKFSALLGGRVEIKFRRFGQDAIRIQFRTKDSEKWQVAGFYTYSPAYHDVPPAPDGRPQALEYRARLYRKNAPVGQYSSVFTVITMP